MPPSRSPRSRKASREAARAGRSARSRTTSPPSHGKAARRGARGGSAPAAVATARPAGWLVKTEPSDYAWSALVREGRVTWDGVTNPLARIHLRAMREGDPVLVYHSGSERAVVGLARVARGPHAPPGSPPGFDPARGAVVVDLVPVSAAPAPVRLSDLRDDPACRDFALVRMPRLSTMPVPEPAWRAVLRRAGWPAGVGARPTAASGIDHGT
jgi:predicted RNA-binding protein with PUA-like domain